MLAALNLSKSQFGWVNQATSHVFGETSSQKSELLQILHGQLDLTLNPPYPPPSSVAARPPGLPQRALTTWDPWRCDRFWAPKGG